MLETTDDLNRIFAWLTRELRRQAMMNILGGVATLLAGIGILVVTWAVNGFNFRFGLVAGISSLDTFCGRAGLYPGAILGQRSHLA
jgi:hypothetical protein